VIAQPIVHAAADIEAIERATLAAVSPRRLEELPGWLLAFDEGTIGRARSAVLQVDEANAPACRLYAALGFRPAWRYRYWRVGD
jgi:hypothetical protein